MQRFIDFMDGAEPVAVPKPYCPRPYQVEAARRVIDILSRADRTAIYVATGCGKTEIAALLCQEKWQGKRILVITPRRELVKQTADRLRLRGVPCGVEMAEQRSDEHVTVACYASMMSRKRFEKYLNCVDLIIVDESHMNFSPAALDMLAQFRSWGARVCGMTASPPVRKKGVIIDGRETVLADHYGEPAFIYDYLTAVRDGYLVSCKLHTCVLTDLDLSRFKASFGDFDATRLDKLMRNKANVAGVGLMIAKYWDGKPSVVFCSSIKHAEAVRDDIAARGIAASIVHSQMDADEQALHLRDYMTGKSKVVINVGILTLGWDAPHTRKLFLARPTASPCLYVQMFGRGTRCLAGTIDGIDTVEGRLAAIAASDKSHMEVYDITDASRTVSITSAFDILYPDVDDRLMKRVKARLPRQPQTKEQIDSVIEAERKLLAAEQAALDREEMARRGHIVVDGEVVAYRREITADEERLGGGRRTTDYWWMPYGKYKGRKFSAIPRRYLEVLLPYVKDEGLARNIRRYLSGQNSNAPKPQPVTEQQEFSMQRKWEEAGSRLLAREGYDPNDCPF
jgi:superfamily II DNA or RNA helicase